MEWVWSEELTRIMTSSFSAHPDEGTHTHNTHSHTTHTIDCIYTHICEWLAMLYKIFRHPPYGHVIKLRVWCARV